MRTAAKRDLNQCEGSALRGSLSTVKRSRSCAWNDARMICCGASEGGLVKRIAVVSMLALVVLATANKMQAQSSESSTEKKIEAIFSSVTSPDEPGLASGAQKRRKRVRTGLRRARP